MAEQQDTNEAEVITLHDGDFTAEIRHNGLWPKGHASEADRPAYSLTITHKEFGQMEHQPQCASNHGFCARTFETFVNSWREEEARRQVQENGEIQNN